MSEINDVASSTREVWMQPNSNLRIDPNGYVTARDAARILGVSERTLRSWRDRRVGPRAEYRMLWGSHWRYDLPSIYRHILYQSLS
jgi:hypothetical protein